MIIRVYSLNNIQQECVSSCESLRNVRRILTRCTEPQYLDDAVHELHYFGHACQDTYGCVIYPRTLNKHSDINVPKH